MAFFHTLRVVQRTVSGERTVTLAKRISAYEQPGKINEIARKAMNWPATVRIEIDEEDTQLYAYPADERTYQSQVLHKDGRMFRFYGKGSNLASLVESFDTRKNMHTYRLS